MTNQSKNIINAIHENLQSVFVGLKHFDLFEDRHALEDCLAMSQEFVLVIDAKFAKLREEEKIKSCNNLVMARRPYSTKRELIPECMTSWSSSEVHCCKEKKAKR